jgi:hypothetical protein
LRIALISRPTVTPKDVDWSSAAFLRSVAEAIAPIFLSHVLIG